LGKLKLMRIILKRTEAKTAQSALEKNRAQLEIDEIEANGWENQF
jgi:hypothetical protein